VVEVVAEIHRFEPQRNGATAEDIDAGQLESSMRQIDLVRRAVSLTVALLRAGVDLTYAPEGPPTGAREGETGSPIDILRTGPRSHIGGQIDAGPCGRCLAGQATDAVHAGRGSRTKGLRRSL
jgi:hypothetical protein